MSELYDELVSIGQQISHHRQRLAKPRVERLVLDRLDARTSNRHMLAHLIAESLLKRIDRTLHDARNIYVETFDIPQIVLFYRLARAIPLIGAAHRIANDVMWRHLKGSETVTVVDVGVGNGWQMRQFVSQVVMDPTPAKRVRVIGIDPSPDNLQRSAAALAEVTRALPIEVDWLPIENTLENIPEGQLEAIVGAEDTPLAINGAFALHHAMHPVGDTGLRTRLLERLAAMNPKVIALSEPHSNHDTENLAHRIHHAWSHFGSVFDMIDRSGVDAATRFTIKEKFFGREIRDIFGVSDHFRCERHEPYDAWLLRLARCGLAPVPMAVPNGLLPEHIETSVDDGLVRLGYRGTVIVAIMAYRPSQAGLDPNGISKEGTPA